MATRSPNVARSAADAGQVFVKEPARPRALVIDGPGVIDTLAEVEAAIAMRQQANNSTPK
jgi:hypothetical protein